jgi:5-methylcytosine-specific restriction endonuclease McrA
VWLLASDVTKNGLCRDHERAAYRAMYAQNRDRIAAEKKARKRGVRVLPTLAREYLLEQFGGRCAYCPAQAKTWDHVIPVADGGETVPGNILPACLSCNSSKKASDLVEWLKCTGRRMSDQVVDVLVLAEVV